MQLTEFCDRLDDVLRIDDYADADASPNGLQVGPGEREVEHVAFAVDAAVATAEAAAAAGADVLLTHHGIFWGGVERLTGEPYRRVAPLVENDLALYVAHLPLDGHQELGNAAGVADVLGLERREPFARVGAEPIGQRGRAPEPYGVDELAALLGDELDTGGADVRTLDFGPDQIERVAVVTGAGTDFFDAAADAGVDAFVTGEGQGRLYHQARERGVNVFLAGHYATETFGVERLQERVSDWGVETTYVDHPTGL